MHLIKKLIDRFNDEYNLHRYMGAVNINLGCGRKPLDGFINTDYYCRDNADMVFDLNLNLPFKHKSADLIYSDNVFEHISRYITLVRECHRVLKDGGYLIIKAPYFKSKHAFVDPTHLFFFTIQSLDYFVINKFFYAEYRFFDDCFSCLKVYLDPSRNYFLKKIISIYAVALPNRFENSILSNIFIFHNIVYVLRK